MLGNLLNRSQNRSVESFPLPPRGASIQPLTGGMNVTRSTLLSHVVANRCVSIISDQIGALDLQAERNGEPIPTPAVLARPELDRTRSEFIAAAVTSLLVNGNAYILAGRRDSLGYPQSVVLLDPEAVDIKTVGGAIQYRAAGSSSRQRIWSISEGSASPAIFEGSVRSTRLRRPSPRPSPATSTPPRAS